MKLIVCAALFALAAAAQAASAAPVDHFVVKRHHSDDDDDDSSSSSSSSDDDDDDGTHPSSIEFAIEQNNPSGLLSFMQGQCGADFSIVAPGSNADPNGGVTLGGVNVDFLGNTNGTPNNNNRGETGVCSTANGAEAIVSGALSPFATAGPYQDWAVGAGGMNEPRFDITLPSAVSKVYIEFGERVNGRLDITLANNGRWQATQTSAFINSSPMPMDQRGSFVLASTNGLKFNQIQLQYTAGTVGSNSVDGFCIQSVFYGCDEFNCGDDDDDDDDEA